jgi:uncharacterized protein YciI
MERRMARWVAIFEDNTEAEAGWVRKQHAADHFEYLKTNSDRIRLAGGLRPGPDDWWNGGLWVLEVETRAQAEALCENDPFFKLGLRRSYRLQVWGKAPIYGDVVL